MAVDLADPATWPSSAIVVRCGSAQGIRELAERLSREGSWSVFTGPGASFSELARSCRNNQIRCTTVQAVLAAGGSLRPSPGPPHHHDLFALPPEQVDALPSVPAPHPVPNPDRSPPASTRGRPT